MNRILDGWFNRELRRDADRLRGENEKLREKNKGLLEAQEALVEEIVVLSQQVRTMAEALRMCDTATREVIDSVRAGIELTIDTISHRPEHCVDRREEWDEPEEENKYG